MAKGGGFRGQGRRASPTGRTSARAPGRAPKAKKDAAPAHPAAPPPPATFVLGVIPGATPGGWIDVWKERMPHTALELMPLAVAAQREALLGATGSEVATAASETVDAALVRLPIDTRGLSVIALYDEIAVVVCSADSHLTAADELDAADLAGEVLIVPRDDVLGITVPGTVAPSFSPPEDTEQAIATVAAGVGIVIVPMSLARLHRRKDVTSRPLRDAPVSTVALAWPTERTTSSVESFIGIVRGRTANSSRG